MGKAVIAAGTSLEIEMGASVRRGAVKPKDGWEVARARLPRRGGAYEKVKDLVWKKVPIVPGRKLWDPKHGDCVLVKYPVTASVENFEHNIHIA